MAIDKDFVIKSGLQVNENLIYADPDTDRVGLGTTTADKKLVVIGDQETSASLSVGTTITAQRLVISGITTTVGGIDVGVGGTIFNTQYNATDINGVGVGINSTDPRYTLEVIGPVSIGDTAQFIFGDLTVTGDISGASLSGQISAGGTVGFTNVTVDKNLIANNYGVYTLFRLQEFGGDRFRFLTAGDPPGIGFTQNQDDPEIYLVRGQTYQFDVDSGGFPFYIKRQPTADLNNIYDDGVVNNGIQVGIVTFKVPFNAPNELYYQASNTAGMGGTIFVTNDGKNINVGVATITQLINASTAQADFLNIFVSGIGTINNLKGPQNFSVSAGILTVRQDQTALIGVSTGTDAISVQENSNNVNYQVPFTPTLGIGSNYQNLFVDSENDQMMYNPSTNILTVNRVVGNLSGIATGADNINIDSKADSTNYQVTFSDPGLYGYQRQYIDSESDRLIYNPSTNTLSVTNIISSTVTAGLAGTATRADFLNIDSATNNTAYQIVFNSAGGTDYQRLYIDGEAAQLTYNPFSNVFFAQNITGAGDNITDLNASNLSQGTVNNDRLLKATTSQQGIVQLDDTYPPTSTSVLQTATTNVSRKLYLESTAVIPAGSVMLFYQTAAPTGWTKLTTQDNKALRVVSGAGGGTGGNTAFTTVFASGRVVPLPQHNHVASSGNNSASHTHTVTGNASNASATHNHGASINSGGNHAHGVSDPGHSHSYQRASGGVEYGDRSNNARAEQFQNTGTGNSGTGVSVNSSGSSHSHGVDIKNGDANHSHTVTASAGTNSNPHSHTITINNEGTSGANMNFDVQYIDVIQCSKDAYPSQ